MGSPKPVIFISYSREDRRWLKFVESHLQVEDVLSTCAAFILLVSRYSLTSDFILKKEVRAALEARCQNLSDRRGGMRFPRGTVSRAIP